MNACLWDASAALKLVTDEPGTDNARRLFAETSRNTVLGWTSAEVANALWKRVMRGAADPDSAAMAFETWLRLDFESVEPDDFAPIALELALRHRHPVHDCLYLALALTEELPLATADTRLAAIARDAGVDVVKIGLDV